MKSQTWDHAKCTSRVPTTHTPNQYRQKLLMSMTLLQIGNMSAQSLNLLKLNWTVAVESNSKPATQGLKLFHWQKNIILEEYQLKMTVFTSDVGFPGSPIPHRNQPEHFPSTIPSEASPSPIARCLPRRAGMTKAGRFPWTSAQWIHAMG